MNPSLRKAGRGIGAVAAGLALIIVASIATDQILHSAGVYPPWGEPMHGHGLNLLALSYRLVYAVAGSYVAARLAAGRPMAHAMALGVIGLVLGTAGAVAAIGAEMGPAWFPIALVVTALPCAWLGGRLHVSAARKQKQDAGGTP